MEALAWFGLFIILLLLSFVMAFIIALFESKGDAECSDLALGLSIVVIALCLVLSCILSNSKVLNALNITTSANTVEETK